MDKKFGIYIGIRLHDDNLALIKQLVEDNMTENPVKRGNMLYLKEKYISEIQKRDIFNEGPMTVKVKF